MRGWGQKPRKMRKLEESILDNGCIFLYNTLNVWDIVLFNVTVQAGDCYEKALPWTVAVY